MVHRVTRPGRTHAVQQLVLADPKVPRSTLPEQDPNPNPSHPSLFPQFSLNVISKLCLQGAQDAVSSGFVYTPVSKVTHTPSPSPRLYMLSHSTQQQPEGSCGVHSNLGVCRGACEEHLTAGRRAVEAGRHTMSGPCCSGAPALGALGNLFLRTSLLFPMLPS